jgi:hypothetical protein
MLGKDICTQQDWNIATVKLIFSSDRALGQKVKSEQVHQVWFFEKIIISPFLHSR